MFWICCVFKNSHGILLRLAFTGLYFEGGLKCLKIVTFLQNYFVAHVEKMHWKAESFLMMMCHCILVKIFWSEKKVQNSQFASLYSNLFSLACLPGCVFAKKNYIIFNAQVANLRGKKRPNLILSRCCCLK